MSQLSHPRRCARVFVILAPILIITGCTGNLFGVNLFIVGEQTSLEKQVLGTYSALAEDLLIYSSVRGVDEEGNLQPSPPTTESQRLAFAAMRNREYNRDDVLRMLRLGVIGEANSGLVETRNISIPIPNLSAGEAQLIIEEENRDREAILGRLVGTAVEVQPEDTEEIAWIFARLNQDAAPQRAWVQTREGQWVRK